MKRKITIELEGQWVLSHREDEVLPAEALGNRLNALGIFQTDGVSLTSLFVVYDGDKLSDADAERKIRAVFAEGYPKENTDEILSLQAEQYTEEKPSASSAVKNAGEQPSAVKNAEGQPSAAKTAKDKSPAENSAENAPAAAEQSEEQARNDAKEAVMAKIDKLVGAEEFKTLAREIADVSAEIRRTGTYEVFLNRSYLFAIGEGCGLTTYLNMLAELVEGCGLATMSNVPVVEQRLGAYGDNMDAFDDVMRLFENGSKNRVKVLCIDISEWMGKTGSRYFKAFLRVAEKHAEEFILVFRVPFVEKDVLAAIKYSLNDLLNVKTVTFPPLSRNEIKGFAQSELNRFSFELASPAWGSFFERISEEKSDGKFYGINTIRKVVKELVYYKQLQNARSGKAENVIGKSEADALCVSVSDDELTGMEQLNRLVGSEQIKKRIEEIVAQIELSVRENSAERPCIHMRFVGNPGTGKTTVARIIGKILKEKGVLRIGNFYEYSGRDLCGRYVGETAPKTAGICRDAYGSVLFIDEAYSLYRGDDNSRDYGREALDTLIAEMENHRNDFVVIMAGYTDDMEKLMEGNIGLASRMPYTLEFPNFTRGQLYEIFVSMVKGRFSCDDKLLDSARSYFNGLPEELLSAKEFSNARFVRNLFERTWAKAAMRCQLDGENKVTITGEDFGQASADKEFAVKLSKKTRIGF